jgi:Alpha-amylase C-terminal beta-sheet domain
VAEIDGKVLVKLGAKSYEPEDAAWRPADKGKAWALWLR